MEALIKLENVSFKYPNDDSFESLFAVNNVSLEIQEGEFVAILGHNGSGKSTTAKLINMILTPNEGKIYIDGKDITDPNMTDDDVFEVRKKVGMVFQNPDNQIVATVVEEDVAFGVENLGIPSDEIRKRVDEALDIVNMTEYARHAPHKLSGGQKQRVAIAGTIAMRPKCIIFDESTAMLDPLGRHKVIDIMEKLNREENITVINITH
ncbi:MAG: ATP-binding cassette domain-containing protein, partial [Clostridia bacterium]|nr:ATP-binding cassette domain-containing protein [Clostridia bacterium]